MNIKVMDTMEAIIIDDATGKAMYFGGTNTGSVSQTVSTEKIKGYIGNEVMSITNSDKEFKFTVENALFAEEGILLANGCDEFTSGSIDIKQVDRCKAETDATKVVIKLTEEPKTGTKVIVKDIFGTEIAATADATDKKKYTVTSGEVGIEYDAIYTVTKATAEYIDLDNRKTGKNKHVQLHTIGYNPITNEVYCDYYWDFYSCVPQPVEMSTGAGKNNGTKIDFETMAIGGSYGRFIKVKRA